MSSKWIRRARLGGVSGTLVLAWAGYTADLLPQAAPAGVRVLRTEVSEPAPFARPFELTVHLRVAPNLLLIAPDSFPSAEDVAPAGAASVSGAEGVVGDSVDIRLDYPLIALLSGSVDLPPLGLRLRNASARAEPMDAVRLDSPSRVEPTAGDATVSISLGAVEVVPSDSVIGASEEVSAAPAAAPVGGSWSAWHFLTLVIAGAGMGLGGWLLLRSRSAAPASGTDRLDREAALRELDRLRDAGWHLAGRTPELYAAATDVLRRFDRDRHVERARGLTTSELATLLEAESDPPSVSRLQEAIQRAERAKFGAAQPQPAQAIGDLEAIRGWIADAAPLR